MDAMLCPVFREIVMEFFDEESLCNLEKVIQNPKDDTHWIVIGWINKLVLEDQCSIVEAAKVMKMACDPEWMKFYYPVILMAYVKAFGHCMDN